MDQLIVTLPYGRAALTEFLTVLRTFGIAYRMLAFNGAAALIESDFTACARVFDRLGGCNRLATVFAEASVKEFSENDLIAKIHTPPENVSTSKPPISVSLYLTSTPNTLAATLQGALMAKCKEWGLSKPVVLPSRFTGKLDGCFYLEAGIDTASRFELARKGVELVVAQFGDSLKLGFTKKIVDPRPFEQDDFDRPVQRRGVTLAPRLARLLVNLAGLTKGVVLDPFCGVGTILQEAMRLKHDVVGVDVQSGMVTASIKNLSWMASVLRAEPFRKERILRGDSRRLTHLLKDRRVDAVVTEPILLPLFKSRPSAEAQRLMSQALNTYGTVMHQISKMLHDGGRVVMVTPTIKTTGRMLTMNLDEHAESSGLKPAQLPEGSLPQPYDLLGSTRWVGRRVHIFQG